MVDQFYAAKLGVSEVGQTFEIQGRRARVVGFTSGIRAFTTTRCIHALAPLGEMASASRRTGEGVAQSPYYAVVYTIASSNPDEDALLV